MPDPREVRTLFARIAARYDLLNRLLSLGIDRRWRAALLSEIGETRGVRAVDVCCGTGDVTLLLARAGAEVLGVDFTPEMLRFAAEKSDRARARARRRPRLEERSPRPGSRPAEGAFGRVLLARGDALALPVASGAADLATVAFGIRNVADRPLFLREMARILLPGGRLLVLEFGAPSNRRLAAAYGLYFRRVLPVVGGLVSGDREAYRYLPRSVASWPGPDELESEISRAGFTDCGHRPLSGGIAFLHWGSSARGDLAVADPRRPLGAHRGSTCP